MVHVLDRFHLEEQLTKLTGHMKDSTQEAREELYKAVCRGTKGDFQRITERLEEHLPEGMNHERFRESRDYILCNWTAAKLRLKKTEGKAGSSTEGHVSHVLSSRMSTQALGWSRTGADKMAQLRGYYLNGGDMLSLVRYQKEGLPKAAGCEEEIILSSREVLMSERDRHKGIGKYVDAISHTLSLNGKRQQYFRQLIWDM